jgi:hypothetical protein
VRRLRAFGWLASVQKELNGLHVAADGKAELRPTVNCIPTSAHRVAPSQGATAARRTIDVKQRGPERSEGHVCFNDRVSERQ